MSQYPYPYAPDPYASADNLRTPGRRAGIMMIVLGSLTLLFGTCAGLAGALWPTIIAHAPPEQLEAMDKITSQSHINAGLMFLVSGVLCFIFGAAYLIVGFFVRKASRAATIVGLVLTSLALLFTLLNIISAATMGAAGFLGACMAVVLFGLFLVAMIWLAQSVKMSGQLVQSQAAQAAQWMQYQQTAQQYGQAGYGYAYPPPPPPPDPGSSGGID